MSNNETHPMVLAAAMSIAEGMDYPWEYMTPEGRTNMTAVALKALTACGALECLEALKAIVIADDNHCLEDGDIRRGKRAIAKADVRAPIKSAGESQNDHP